MAAITSRIPLTIKELEPLWMWEDAKRTVSYDGSNWSMNLVGDDEQYWGWEAPNNNALDQLEIVIRLRKGAWKWN